MKRARLKDLTVEELVDRFVAIALEQDDAILGNDTAKLAPLFWKMEEVDEELKARDGDQRRALLRLYKQPHPQVRLKAAKATLALAPAEGRGVLQAIVDAREFPQAGEADMSLSNLDAGIFKPV
jgi:hypothetical protein